MAGFTTKCEHCNRVTSLCSEDIPDIAKNPAVIAAVFRNLDDEETEDWALATRIAKENREKERTCLSK